jgi:hypothetical protein
VQVAERPEKVVAVGTTGEAAKKRGRKPQPEGKGKKTMKKAKE